MGNWSVKLLSFFFAFTYVQYILYNYSVYLPVKNTFIDYIVTAQVTIGKLYSFWE